MRLTDPVIGGGPKIQVEYVGFDSLGVKSMCTLVRTPEVTITIDPGASIESASFPLPEKRRRQLLRERAEACRQACMKSQAIAISHYHLDHFIPRRDANIYAGKILFAKSVDDLPQRQKNRAKTFHRSIDGLPEQVVWADGRRFRFKKTEIAFSVPIWHGSFHAEPGKVIMTEIKRGKEKALITSDVSGPTSRETTDLICASKAQTVVLDGYPTYHLGRFATNLDLVLSIINVCRILATKTLSTMVIDHHMARDYRYPALFKLAYEKADKLGRQFGTAAELAGRTSAVLQGYQDYGPTRWHRWTPLELDEARRILQKALAESKTATGRTPPSDFDTQSDWLEQFDRWVA